jgi:iron complex transport system substrate-binding protein
MRALVAFLVAGALLASYAWSAALPPPAVASGALATSTLGDSGYPRTLVDPLGERVILRAPPRRIVSIALSGDEILLELVSPDRLVGLTYLVDDPATTPSAALAPATAARVTEENPEGLLALQPDLVVSAGYTRAEPIVLLEAAGVPVVGTGAHATLDDVLDAVTALGDAAGEPDRARALVASLRARIDAVSARPRPAPSARVLLWDHGFTYGEGTLTDDVIRRAGGRDVASEAGMRGPVELGEEAAVSLAPDVVLVPIEDLTPRPHAPELLGDAPVWQAVEAVRRGEVYGVPRAWMGSVSHHVVRALETVASILDGRSRAGSTGPRAPYRAPGSP